MGTWVTRRTVRHDGGVAKPDREDGSLPLTPLRVITILGTASVQVALVCVWRLVTMVRRGTVFSPRRLRYGDVVIGVIVAAALVWFAVTVLNAPGQRADPGVTVIMGGIGVAILGVALLRRARRCGCCSPTGRRARRRSGAARRPSSRRDDLTPIAVDIDVMLARRKMSVGELAHRVGITPANLAVLKNGRARGACASPTLAALCDGAPVPAGRPAALGGRGRRRPMSVPRRQLGMNGVRRAKRTSEGHGGPSGPRAGSVR